MSGSAFVPWRDVRDTTQAACTCGGCGPLDPDVCPACLIYHRLKDRAITFRLLTPPATRDEIEES